MSSAVERIVYTLDGPETYLGPADGRFFGTGFKRVLQSLTGAGDAATATVSYPQGWSTKASGAQRPHLSTVDILLLAARAAGAQVARSHGWSDDDIADAWVRDIVIRAASRPIEDDVDRLLVTVSPNRIESVTDTVVDVTVGSFGAAVTIAHPSHPAERRNSYEWRSGTDVLGNETKAPFGDGYRSHTVRTRNLLVDPVSHVITADSSLDVEHGSSSTRPGLSSSFEASTSLIDVFVEALQLGQILLYDLDGISRSSSNTLWMRRTMFSVDASSLRVRDAQTRVALENTRLVSRGDESWRLCDIVSQRGGISMKCSVTHRVPK